MLTRMSVSWLIICAAAAVAYPATLAAQEGEPYVIQGIVRDARSTAPLEGAVVTLRGTGRSARTDDQGQFTLTATVEPGTYELEYAAIGRRRTVQTITLGATQTMTMDPVALEQTAVMLDELVVSGVGARLSDVFSGTRSKPSTENWCAMRPVSAPSIRRFRAK